MRYYNISDWNFSRNDSFGNRTNYIIIKMKSERILIVGDIHGSYLGLKQVLERSNFDYENDVLITIGDIVDGWGDSFMVVEELLKIKNRVDIMGNHDSWFREFLQWGVHPLRWGMGGLSTATSYAKGVGLELMVEDQSVHGEEAYMLNFNSGDVPESHHIFFRRQNHYYKDFEKNLFIHGGFDRMTKLSQTLPYIMMWDRHLWKAAMSIKDTSMKLMYLEDFNQIFIGHTPTPNWDIYEPIKADKIWNVDTGAGGGGKLTIMDIHTNEFWQSDSSPLLYPDDPHKKKNFKG